MNSRLRTNRTKTYGNGFRKLDVAPATMLNQPTVKIAGDSKQTAVTPSDYFAIRIDTTAVAAGTLSEVILFDANGGFQFKTGKTTPAAVTITGITDNYQFLLNDISQNAAVIHMLQMTVSDATKAFAQYSHQIEVYDIGRGNGLTETSRVYPKKGVHEGQFLKEINTFNVDWRITDRTALVLQVEQGITLDIGFYQAGEIGSKN